MTNPGFSAAATLDRRSPLLRNPRFEVRWSDGEGGIVPQSLPAQCQGQGYGKADCYGVVNVCTDCCQVYTYGAGYNEVCGTPYVCGACLGLPF
ncbi:hypothetical protein ACFCYI_32645 [Streptomyces sp. NPDC056257]|uniref:hypothetical protein n=1 Tax=unclassified Streptomyces TaxID=2593676 RepID=UPI00343FA259